MKKKIVEFLSRVDKASLGEIYAFFDGEHTNSSIRGVVNLMVKDGTIYRPEKATYSVNKKYAKSGGEDA